MRCGQGGERARLAAAAGNEGRAGEGIQVASCWSRMLRWDDEAEGAVANARHGEHRREGEHICFHSKQSGADTAGSSSLLLKAFGGLLRDGLDGVIYPLFAERIQGGA